MKSAAFATAAALLLKANALARASDSSTHGLRGPRVVSDPCTSRDKSNGAGKKESPRGRCPRYAWFRWGM